MAESEQAHAQAEAGWFPDPQGGPMMRYWDGSAWTAHTSPAVKQPAVQAPFPVVAIIAVAVASFRVVPWLRVLKRGPRRHILARAQHDCGGDPRCNRHRSRQADWTRIHDISRSHSDGRSDRRERAIRPCPWVTG